LQALGRVHNQAEALKAAELARYAGFDNFNLDLMFGLPKQSLEEALTDLQQAIDLQPSHLSWYQLTLEPNTLFYKHPPTLPDDDLLVDMQYAGQALLQQAVFEQYEVSAYTQQQPCRHNLNYWEFGDYVGIGAGAHGKITDPFGQVTRHQKYRQPAQYLQQVAQGQARSETQILKPDDLKFEFMLNALRLKAGFSLDLFTERTGLRPETLQTPLAVAEAKGWLTIQDQQVRTTELGWQFLNTVIQLFLD
jgi:oxygen-independent coproporphyrinogen-3 oxidase